jgi:isopentenyl-diphosphate delta-isomerase
MTDKQQQVILVTKDDEPRGTMEKLEAHRKGELHRAFSIFIFDNDGKFLLQKRASEKYHSGGLWTNACCGHPEPGDVMEDKVKQRLLEEMGMSADLHFGFKFLYTAPVGGGLIENELDHVYFGRSNGTPAINPSEVSDWRYTSFNDLKKEVAVNPNSFTEWFKLLYKKAEEFYQQANI